MPAHSHPIDPRSRRLFIALLGAVVLWGGAFIYRTSFVVEGQRVFALFDDAMISMTYARNAVEGHGLVWAREGEPVEGFTTPLWTAVMAPFQAVSIPLEFRPLGLQVLALGLLLLHLVVLRRLAMRFFASGKFPGLSWWPAVLWTASYYPLAYWSLVGMETTLQTLLTTLAVYWTLRIREDGARRGWALGAVLALAYLTRMDMALLAVGCLGFLALPTAGEQGQGRGQEHRPWHSRWRVIAVAGIIPLIAALGYQLFRLAMFDSPLPNTYYLKLTGIPLDIRLGRGLRSGLAFLVEHLAFLLPVGVGLLLRLRHGGRHGGRLGRRWWLPTSLLILYGAYSVWVGGDAWEMLGGVRCNRFMVFILPVFLVVAGSVLGEWTERLLARFPGRRRGVLVAHGLAVVVAALALNGLLPLRRWSALEENWAAVTLTERPLMVIGHEIVYRRLQSLEEQLAPPARVATFWAGIPAYFSDYRMVDMFGYSDRYIARLAPVEKLRAAGSKAYRPGHAKWDYRHVFLEHRPDALLQPWGMQPERLERVMRARGFQFINGFWMRPKSPYRRLPGPMEATGEESD